MKAKTVRKTKTRPYDTVNYLKTEKGCALYLEAVIEESDCDPSLIISALGDIARARRGMTKLAKDTGLTREGLYKSLSKEGNPTFATVINVCKTLGIQFHAEARI